MPVCLHALNILGSLFQFHCGGLTVVVFSQITTHPAHPPTHIQFHTYPPHYPLTFPKRNTFMEKFTFLFSVWISSVSGPVTLQLELCFLLCSFAFAQPHLIWINGPLIDILIKETPRLYICAYKPVEPSGTIINAHFVPGYIIMQHVMCMTSIPYAQAFLSEYSSL